MQHSESTQDLTNSSVQGSVSQRPSFFSYLVEPKDGMKNGAMAKLKGGKKPTKLTKKAFDGLEAPVYFTKEEMAEQYRKMKED